MVLIVSAISYVCKAQVILRFQTAGADPGFLVKGFICIKVWGSLG